MKIIYSQNSPLQPQQRQLICVKNSRRRPVKIGIGAVENCSQLPRSNRGLPKHVTSCVDDVRSQGRLLSVARSSGKSGPLSQFTGSFLCVCVYFRACRSRRRVALSPSSVPPAFVAACARRIRSGKVATDLQRDAVSLRPSLSKALREARMALWTGSFVLRERTSLEKAAKKEAKQRRGP